jgi:hypothetical protein
MLAEVIYAEMRRRPKAGRPNGWKNGHEVNLKPRK